jgi:SsrA-binding protein
MAPKNDKAKNGIISHGLVAENRRSRYDYEIGETMEAGLVLTGTEVKSLRLGKAQITESYASPERGELWLINAHIPEYLQANRFNHEERRPRKLLVSKKQLAHLDQEVARAGNTIVPLKLFFNDQGRAKVLIGVGKGKKNYDKRATERDRDWNRDKSRIMKEGGRGTGGALFLDRRHHRPRARWPSHRLGQVRHVDEEIRLPPQVVRDHRRRAGERRDHRHPLALALQGRHQGGEIPVAGKQHHVIVERRQFQGIDTQLDVHVAFHLAPPRGIGELLGRLGNHGEAIIVQPVDQRADGRIFLVLDQRGVIVGAQQIGAAIELGQQAPVVDIDADGLGRGVEIGAINEQNDLFPGVDGHRNLQIGGISAQSLCRRRG